MKRIILAAIVLSTMACSCKTSTDEDGDTRVLFNNDNNYIKPTWYGGHNYIVVYGNNHNSGHVDQVVAITHDPHCGCEGITGESESEGEDEY